MKTIEHNHKYQMIVKYFKYHKIIQMLYFILDLFKM